MGTITNQDGTYKLAVLETDKALVFSFVGMKTIEVIINNQNVINIVMEDQTTEIDQVVVTGYFTRKKESFTGATITVKGEELKNFGNNNVLQSLSVIDPSFKIVENNISGSNPNVMSTIQINGQSGLPDLKGEYSTNPNQPLFILDGFETTQEKIYDLDMNLVESITLLKDATAKAIYGSKAANGVVVVETKRPKEGTLMLTYNGSMDITAADLTSYNLCDARQKLQAELMAGLYTNSNPETQADLTKKYSDLLKEVNRGVNTYWLSQPLRLGVGQKHSVYLAGGDNAMRYSINAYYNNIKGVMIGSDRTTISGTINLQYRYKNLSFKNNLSIDRNKAINSPYGDFSDYTKMNPYWRIHDEDGALIKTYGASGYGVNFYNPLYNASLNTKNFNTYTTITENFYGEWALLDNLRITARVGVSNNANGSEYFIPASHTNYANVSPSSDEYLLRGKYTINNGESSAVNSDFGINYSLALKKHLITANLFYSIGQAITKSTGMTAVGFPNDKMDDISFANSYEIGSPTGSENTSRNIGITSAVNYAFDNRYLADLSYRANASSQFGADNRWGQFWSVGLGWNLHNEAFLKGLGFVDLLKFRASTGYTGAQNFNSYQSVATYKYITDQTYNGDMGEYLLGLANPGLRWQQTQDNNIGIDFGVLKQINISVDIYSKITKDLLTDITLPPSTGFSTYKENLGETENKGFQVMANYRVFNDVHNRNYFNLFFSISKNTDKVKKISNALSAWNKMQDETKDGSSIADGLTDPSTRFEEGQSINTIWAVRSLGIDPANGKEIFVKKDGTLTYVWSSADQVAAGVSLLKYTGSFGANARYKGFGLNVAFTYRFGGQIYNQTLVDKVENANMNWNVDERVLNDRWNKPGQEALYKNIADVNTTKPTTRFVQDLRELNFSSLSFSYDFSDLKFVKSFKIKQLNLLFNMNDIGRLSSVKVERGLSYPFARTFSFALQTTF